MDAWKFRKNKYGFVTIKNTNKNGIFARRGDCTKSVGRLCLFWF